MTITALPLNDSEIADAAQWAKLAGHWAEDGVIAGELSEFAVSAGTGMTVDVAAGRAIIQGVFLESDITVPKSLSAADTTNDRIDLIVARVDFVNGKNYSGVYVVEGTPAATPTAPSPTQSAGVVWEIPLAEVRVAAGATSISASDITDRRTYAAPIPHASSHATGGSDPIAPADIGAATESQIDDRFKALSYSSTVDWDTQTNPGVNALLTGDAPNGPGGTDYYYCLVYVFPTGDTDSLVQIAVPYRANATSAHYYRTRYHDDPWTAWAQIWDSNAIQHISGTGECVRHPDGLQMCWYYGLSIAGGSNATWTYPAAFSTSPTVVVSGYRANMQLDSDPPGTTSVSIRNDSTDSRSAGIIAIGKWT